MQTAQKSMPRKIFATKDCLVDAEVSPKPKKNANKAINKAVKPLKKTELLPKYHKKPQKSRKEVSNSLKSMSAKELLTYLEKRNVSKQEIEELIEHYKEKDPSLAQRLCFIAFEKLKNAVYLEFADEFEKAIWGWG